MQTTVDKFLTLSIIAKKLKKWSSLTTAHGFHRIQSSKNTFYKNMWFFFILLSFCFCAYMISRSILTYFEYNVNSKISVINQPEMPLPQISFCNLNPLITPAADRYILDFFERHYNVTLPNVTTLLEYKNSSSFQQKKLLDDDIMNEFIFYQTFHPNFDTSLRQSFGYSLDEMFIRVIDMTIMKKIFNYENHFLSYYDSYYGNCFIFNTDYSANQSVPILKVN